MKTISSLKQLKEIVGDSVFYVRWSNGPTVDKKYGFSRDHQTGERHAGLSANQVNPSDDDVMILTKISEYITICAGTKAYGWICFAERNGTDSDNAATIDASTIKVVGKIDQAWANKINKWSIARADHYVLSRRIYGSAALAKHFESYPKPEDFQL